MGGACSTYGGEKMHTEFWRQNLREGNQSECLGLNVRITLNLISKMCDGSFILD